MVPWIRKERRGGDRALFLGNSFVWRFIAIVLAAFACNCNVSADRADYRGNLNYRWNDELMTYASVASEPILTGVCVLVSAAPGFFGAPTCRF
jgi:hypothetical protein